jgi:hypothetical protein
LAVNRQQGFVLAASVWMMAVVMLLAGIFHTWVESQVESARVMLTRQQNALDIASTRETLLYLLSTRRMTMAGLTQSLEDQKTPVDRDGNPLMGPVGGELRLDGTQYAGLGAASFSLQDQAGLLAINSRSMPDTIRSWLQESEGATTARRLAASLADYIDENTRRQIDGAEAADYRQKGLAPPTNFYLRSPAELSAVLVWREWLQTQNGAQWYDLVAITRANVLNVNTMPKPLLKLSMGLSEPEAEELLAARRRYPLRNLDSVARELGIPNTWQQQQFRFFPAERVTVRFSAEGWGNDIVESVRLTAEGEFGPFLIDYRFRERGDEERRVGLSKQLDPGSYFEKELLAES